MFRDYYLISIFLLISIIANSQEEYKFKDVVNIPVTSVKSQNRSGTCWSFSTISFIEAELIRLGKGDHNLSEMFPVRYTYLNRAKKYVRYHGHLNFSGGAQSWDVIDVVKKYGVVPEEVYGGIEYGEENHVHGEMDYILKLFVEGIVANKSKKLTTVWPKAMGGILDAYLGEVPETFNYRGSNYTVDSFTKDLGLRNQEYIAITSFSHHEYNEKFIFESPDNWVNRQLLNVSLDRLVEIVENALDKGHSVQWSSDISEKGFDYKRGVAIVPDRKWEEKSDIEKENTCVIVEKEKEITEKMRFDAFENYTTTDDHAMHIVGSATDQNGQLYFKVKNSWGIESKYKGYFYVSYAYFKYKTMSILLNKEAI